MLMKLSQASRIIRVAAGLIILSQAFIGAKSPWAYFGLAPLLAGLTGVCPPVLLWRWLFSRPEPHKAS